MFGMGKVPFQQIFAMLEPELQRTREGENPTVLPALHRFLIYLQFMRTNSFQRAVGSQHFIQVSQSVVCNTVNEVAKMLASRVPEFVQFPSEEESKHIAEEIYLQTGLPGTIGIADGTHFEITKPIVQHPLPERFYNRKHYCSINSLMISDHHKRIRYFTCGHAGSAHDSKIWNESRMRHLLETRFVPLEPKYLIGDEGFGCSNVMFTVVRQAQLEKISDPAFKEKCVSFNRALKKARIAIEHTFGMLKKRFPALLYEMRSRKLSNTCAIIASAVVLHNILLKHHEELSPPELPGNISEETFRRQMDRLDMLEPPTAGRPTAAQFKARNSIIEAFF
jgi:hypothetical protein